MLTRFKSHIYMGAVSFDEGGGGSITDYVPQLATLPTASSAQANKIVEYKGATTSDYTNGYFYKCTGTTTYSASVAFEENKITVSDANYLSFLQDAFPNTFINIVSGKMIYHEAADLWSYVGYNSDGEIITKRWNGAAWIDYQLYTDDWEDLGFTFNYTPEDEDEVAFTNTITIVSETYSWSRINVQPTSTFLPFPSDFITNGSLQTVADSIVASAGAKEGAGYLGGISGSCMPWSGGGNAECKVEFMTDGIAVLTLTSSNVPPYRWEYNTAAGDYKWKISTMQFSTMPSANVLALGVIVQYTGITDSNYTNGYFYKCIDDGVYKWQQVDVQPKLDLKAITGYDATKTQTLKNVSGTLTWVDD